MFKKAIIAAIIAATPMVSFAQKIDVQISVECTDTNSVLGYLGKQKAKVIALEKIPTEDGGEAIDYVVAVDGKIVTIREKGELSCVLSEVKITKQQGKNNV